MKRYILNLEGYSEETAARIIQNIRFWCVDLINAETARYMT